jgi:hypothetical protein
MLESSKWLISPAIYRILPTVVAIKSSSNSNKLSVEVKGKKIRGEGWRKSWIIGWEHRLGIDGREEC